MTRTPTTCYEIPILEVLYDLGGCGCSSTIFLPPTYLTMILSQKGCAGRSRTNVPTPGYNIQSLFRILPQHTVALRCAKSLELPQNGFLRGNQLYLS